jgi:hypothetical protein
VGLCVCSLIAREWINLSAPNLTCLFLDTRKRTWEGQNFWKGAMSSISGEGVSSISETKHGRRMVPRPKLFVSKRRLQKQRPEHPKIVLSSILSKDGFCSSDTKHNRRTASRPNLFVSKKRLYKQKPQHRKLSWVRILTRKFYVAPKLSANEQRRQGKICLFRRGDYRN